MLNHGDLPFQQIALSLISKLAVNELICSIIQIRFYYKSGDYVAISDIYRLLSKCTATPDLMLKKLLEMNIIGVTENNGVVIVK